MSLEIVRQVNTEHPELLQQNINASCYQFVVFVIEKLRAAGHSAYHVCKTAGEGQYQPPGFTPRTVAGLDGKPYVITGVSHDALYCDGKQYDTVAQGNDSPDPIGMHGIPVWNAIPPEYWRPQNPPLVNAGPVPVPVPPPPAQEPYPGDAAFDDVGAALFSDYAQAGNAPDAQMGRWFGRTIYDWLAKNEKTLAASVAKHRKEWRAALGLPPL